jgi:hypothetical protein
VSSSQDNATMNLPALLQSCFGAPESAQQAEHGEVESSISLDHTIRSIGTSEVHLRKLSLNLVNLTTQVLDIA